MYQTNYSSRHKCIIILCIITFHVGVTVSFSVARAQMVQQQIQKAMELSNQGQVDITAAHAASDLWPQILNPPPPSSSTTLKEEEESTIINQPNIRMICNALFASTLVRIGRDDKAIPVFDEIIGALSAKNKEGITMLDQTDQEMYTDIKFKKAESLQRLMRYSEAFEEFSAVCNLTYEIYDNNNEEIDKKKYRKMNIIGTKAACSVATCALRINEAGQAEQVLSKQFVHLTKLKEQYHSDVKELYNIDGNLSGMLGTLRMILLCTDNNTVDSTERINDSIQLLKYAAQCHNASPLYKWLYAVSTSSLPTDDTDQIAPLFDIQNDSEDDFLNIASINQSPFDDSSLIHLDNKVLLHRLLTNTNISKNSTLSKHWPVGFVFPGDEDLFLQFCKEQNTKTWILKEQAGYGSHGNSIVSTDQVMETWITNRRTCDEDKLEGAILCQKVVEPPLLIDKKIFSLRVYVIYYQSHNSKGSSGTENEEDHLGYECYISPIGLMKFALSEYDELNSDDAQMTNSGRVQSNAMIQNDFEYLKSELDEEFGTGTYDAVWSSITKASTEIMKAYFSSYGNGHNKNIKGREGTFLLESVPKIMGFDFILDSFLNPWLMEVNRFPGLEARDKSDSYVKSRVVENSWKVSSNIAKVDCGLQTTIHNLDQMDLEPPLT